MRQMVKINSLGEIFTKWPKLHQVLQFLERENKVYENNLYLVHEKQKNVFWITRIMFYDRCQ